MQANQGANNLEAKVQVLLRELNVQNQDLADMATLPGLTIDQTKEEIAARTAVAKAVDNYLSYPPVNATEDSLRKALDAVMKLELVLSGKYLCEEFTQNFDSSRIETNYDVDRS